MTRRATATEAERREARLAAALRANLRRRKDQTGKRGIDATPLHEVASTVASDADRP